jgi:hypothetical protein
MERQQTIERHLASVRIYCDEDAHLRDEFGKHQGSELKPVHDHLFQRAIDLKLASALVFIDWRRAPPQPFREKCQTALERPAWWPATRTHERRQSVLMLPLSPLAAAPFGKNWQNIRAAAAPSPKWPNLWEQDPALIFSPAPKVFFCRTASVGHEGLVYYFVYGAREQEWESELVKCGLSLGRGGEEGYRLLVPEPGACAGQ